MFCAESAVKSQSVNHSQVVHARNEDSMLHVLSDGY